MSGLAVGGKDLIVDFTTVHVAANTCAFATRLGARVASILLHALVKIGSARNTKACLTQRALCFFPELLSYPAVGGIPWRKSSLTSADMPPSPKVFLRSAVGFSRLIGAALSLPATHGPSSRVQRICNNSSRSRMRSLIPPVSLQYPKRPMTCLLLTW